MYSKTLSISIAAYNVEQFLRKTLDSLILDDDHMSELEVIVVNDGSKDGTQLIAEEYVQNYPETFCLINKPNGGYGSTINASLAQAKGRYYKLLDGDDWYDSDALCGLLDYLKNTHADLVISPYYTVNVKATEVPHHSEIPEQTIALESLHLKDNGFQMHGITVKTETIRQLNHSIATHCFYTDLEYIFYCIVASRTISRYNRGVYYYRLGVNGQSVSREGIQKHYKEHLTVTERICQCYENECQELVGRKKDIVDNEVTIAIYGVFNSYMVLYDSRKHRQELKHFDEYIKKQYPKAYQQGYYSSVVKTVRKLGFRFYGLLCAYMKFKLGRF